MWLAPGAGVKCGARRDGRRHIDRRNERHLPASTRLETASSASSTAPVAVGTVPSTRRGGADALGANTTAGPLRLLAVTTSRARGAAEWTADWTAEVRAGSETAPNPLGTERSSRCSATKARVRRRCADVRGVLRRHPRTCQGGRPMAPRDSRGAMGIDPRPRPVLRASSAVGEFRPIIGCLLILIFRPIALGGLKCVERWRLGERRRIPRPAEVGCCPDRVARDRLAGQFLAESYETRGCYLCHVNPR